MGIKPTPYFIFLNWNSMNYYEVFKEVPSDPILGIAAKHRKDPNPDKINLSIGVYKSEEGEIAVLDAVHKAEKILWEQKNNKGYPPIDGDPGFKEEVLKLLTPQENHDYFYVAHTVGATSAVRLTGELMRTMGIKNVYYSDQTWPNHPHIYSAAGLNPVSFPYYDSNTHKLKINEICQSLQNAPSNSAVLFQMCCHNPTGRDPSIDEWKQIIQIIKEKGLFPILDCAYQGFGQGMEEDVMPFKLMMESVDQMFVCYSCAKNFGLYGERVGAFIAFDKSKKNLTFLDQNARKIIRCNYSTPPLHGARIVKTILKSNELSQLWRSELKEMRIRIKNLRQLFLKSLEEKKLGQDYKFIIKDEGLFSLLYLPVEKIIKLREESSIYLLENGRVNIAGLSQKNMEFVTTSIQKILV